MGVLRGAHRFSQLDNADFGTSTILAPVFNDLEPLSSPGWTHLTVLTSPGPASPLTIAIYIDIDRLSNYWSNIFNIIWNICISPALGVLGYRVGSYSDLLAVALWT